VITAVHTLIYAEDAERARAFLRDVLGWPHVDAGHGWLIFGTGPSELGVHPTEAVHRDDTTVSVVPRHHEVALMCDDVEATVADLTGRGVEFLRPVRDDGFGLTTELLIPGAGPMMLSPPRHPVAYDR
jgi:catechol 2,3-dioxygenase-like lactoylglutathione lyase family enzyme